MHRFICASVFLAFISPLGAQQSDIQMPADLDAAYSSLGMSDRNNQKGEPYQIAAIEIRSYPGEEVIVGIDQNGDGVWDEFIGLQTTEDYDIQGTFKAELIYFRSLCIVRPLHEGHESYVLILNGKKENVALMDKIPPHYLEGQHLYGYGLRFHRGERQFEDFVD